MKKFLALLVVTFSMSSSAFAGPLDVEWANFTPGLKAWLENHSSNFSEVKPDSTKTDAYITRESADDIDGFSMMSYSYGKPKYSFFGLITKEGVKSCDPITSNSVVHMSSKMYLNNASRVGTGIANVNDRAFSMIAHSTYDAASKSFTDNKANQFAAGISIGVYENQAMLLFSGLDASGAQANGKNYAVLSADINLEDTHSWNDLDFSLNMATGEFALSLNGSLVAGMSGNISDYALDKGNSYADMTSITAVDTNQSGSSFTYGSVPANEDGIHNLHVGVTEAPEPATLALLGLGAAALIRRRKRSA